MIRKHADSMPSMPTKYYACCFLLAAGKEQGTTNTQMTGAVLWAKWPPRKEKEMKKMN